MPSSARPNGGERQSDALPFSGGHCSSELAWYDRAASDAGSFTRHFRADSRPRTMKKAAAKKQAAKKPAKVAKKAAARRVAAKPTLLAGGNPQIAKADGDAPVRAYIAAMPG